MKPDTTSDPIEDLIRQHSHKVGENPYFTPRVLNRLPKRARTAKTGFIIALIALIAVVIFFTWERLLSDFNTTAVVTTRDLITVLIMIVVSLSTLAASITLLFTRK